MSRRGVMARKERLAERALGRIFEASEPADPIEQMIRRARKMRARGEMRGAVVLLRRACNEDTERARTWTLLGARLAEVGQYGEAVKAFNQARWLRVRAGERARAEVTARLAAALIPRAA